METKTKPFGIRDKLAYAAGDLGCNMSFALKGTMMIFWTQYMKMESTLYAFLLVIVQIWDAINDPLIGSIIDMDQRKYKLGKFKHYILIGSFGLLICGSLCFIPIPNAPLWAKIILYISGYILWDAFYTITNVPYGSMLSLVSTDAGNRAQLSSWRGLGGMVGNTLPLILIPLLCYSGGDSSNSQNLIGERVFIVALIMGAIGFLCFQFMIKQITIRVDEYSLKINEKHKFNILKALKNFVTNRAAVGATLAAMGMFLGMQSATSATTVLFQSYFKNVQISGIVSLVGFLPMFIFMPFIKKIVNKFGKKESAFVGATISIIAGVLMLILPIEPNKIGLTLYIICLIIFGFGVGIYSCVSWALMADAIDYNEWKNGVREEGTVYSLHSFFRKLAQGIGPSIVLIIMVWLGYNEQLEGNQSASTALNMRWLTPSLYLFSAVLIFIGVGIIYNLNKKTLEQMNKSLKTRIE